MSERVDLNAMVCELVHPYDAKRVHPHSSNGTGRICIEVGDAWIYQIARATSEPLGTVILGISDMVDSTYPADLDPEAHLLRRCIKITEESGEVIEALFGALGENPRKGKTHTMEDVRRELLDVALAALAAIAHFDTGDSINYLQAHAAQVYDRLDSVIAARAARGEGEPT